MKEIKSDRLEALFASYREDLQVQVKELEQVWTTLRSDWQEAEAKEFESLCHKIAGAAPTFGFEEVGDKARLMENIIRLNSLQTKPASSEHINDINKNYIDLANALQQSLAVK